MLVFDTRQIGSRAMDDERAMTQGLAGTMSGLAGKVAVVTGGGSDEATARLLAASGDSVVIGDVNVPGGERVAAEINATSGTAIFERCDVTTERDTAPLVQRAVKSFGALHLSANIAGVPQQFSPLTETKLADFERNYLVNQRGMFLSLRAELSAMLENGSGAIVNVASIAALRAFDGLSGYVSSKHGALDLSRTTASENADRGIRMNCVAPGATATPMLLGTGAAELEAISAAQPMRRLSTPEEIANVVGFLLSDLASYVSGVAVSVDGAWMARSG
jgi:NAD(P)-dependent dehydrogenase (short-subunit alcohol dehydrogenase family)